MPVCPDRLRSADVDASSFVDVLLASPTLRIAIHRGKGDALKFLFILVPFLFGGCFILFKDREAILPAIVAAGARALLVSLHLLMLSVAVSGTERIKSSYGRLLSIASSLQFEEF
jgi:hypothetical protein